MTIIKPGWKKEKEECEMVRTAGDGWERWAESFKVEKLCQPQWRSPGFPQAWAEAGGRAVQADDWC
jgi:hypothetical protein